MALRRPFIRFACNARQAMLPTGSQVWTSLRRHRRQHIRRWSMRAQRSAIMFHVKPGVDRTHWRIQHVSARSTAHGPFSHSLCAAERPWGASEARRRIRSTQRCHDVDRTAATRRRGRGWRQTTHDTNRLSSSTWGNATSEVDAEPRRIRTGARDRLPILRPFVSRETCCWLRPNSIPAQTGVSFMAGEGPGAN